MPRRKSRRFTPLGASFNHSSMLTRQSRTVQVEWPVPRPLQRIVNACKQEEPGDRPTLEALKKMVEETSELEK